MKCSQVFFFFQKLFRLKPLLSAVKTKQTNKKKLITLFHLLLTTIKYVFTRMGGLNVPSLVLTPVIASLVIILHSLKLMNVLMLALELSFST